jgi:hypothetical protein
MGSTAQLGPWYTRWASLGMCDSAAAGSTRAEFPAVGERQLFGKLLQEAAQLLWAMAQQEYYKDDATATKRHRSGHVQLYLL